VKSPIPNNRLQVSENPAEVAHPTQTLLDFPETTLSPPATEADPRLKAISHTWGAVGPTLTPLQTHPTLPVSQ